MSAKQATLPLPPLPDGCTVLGELYADPAHDYELGDVFVIELPNGCEVDVSHRRTAADKAFVISVYLRLPGHAHAQPHGEWAAARPEDVLVHLPTLVKNLMRVRLD